MDIIKKASPPLFSTDGNGSAPPAFTHLDHHCIHWLCTSKSPPLKGSGLPITHMVQTTTKLQLLFVCFLVLQPEVTTMFSSKAKAMQQSERFQNCSAWWIPNTTFKINNDGCSMIRRCIKQQLSKLHSFHSWNHLYHCEFHQSTQYHTVFKLKACE